MLTTIVTLKYYYFARWEAVNKHCCYNCKYYVLVLFTKLAIITAYILSNKLNDN